ncbi:alpha-glucosidase related protein [Thermoplasma acidophilum]|uniref:Alpha-glucosidase related protein n=1 Tax=Thermoplasma acidophilum (strain ATCC 25905 / DSM 1728 / JCM 9062 / NBRC 15155 / AMRC-C165) TaxID=273075 RepID=Q9HLD0_THEAC|nr:alpha-glucosidase related protein [Thermoplasma acidophilum]
MLDDIRGFMNTFSETMFMDVINYSLTRDRYDSVFLQRQNYRDLGQLKEILTNDDGIKIKFDGYDLKIQGTADGTIKFTWTDGPEIPVTDPEFVKPRLDNGVYEFGDYRLLIEKDGFSIRDVEGTILHREFFPSFGENITHAFELNQGDIIAGLGEKAAPINMIGHVFRLWNHDANGSYGPDSDPLYVNVPIMLHGHAGRFILILYVNAGDATVDVGYSDEHRVSSSFKSKPLAYYVITGNLDTIYEKLSLITGKPQKPPYWAFEFQQSRYSYMDTKEVRDLVDGFASRGIPLGAVYLDIDYMDRFKMFTFDPQRFGDVKQLTEYMEQKGVKLITIMEPSIKMEHGFDLYEEGLKGGYFVKYPDGNVMYAPVWPEMAAFPDFTDEKAREWYASKYDFMRSMGVSGFWHDMNEPAIFVGWGDNTMPRSAVHRIGRHEEVHNLYGYYMDKAAYDHLSKVERPFILSRSGWAGISRYGWIWTGDTETSWKELKQNIITIMHMSMSGITLTGCDIGGFTGSPTPELFIRWLQASLFFPLYRVHSDKKSKRREPWAFGSHEKEIIEIIRLRHSFVPHIYSEAISSSITGLPLVRPVFWADPSRNDLMSVDDEYTFGGSILIAPIVEEHAVIRRIILPSGRWYNISDDRIVEGSLSINVDLSTVPIFVREGSAILRENDGIELHLYLANERRKSILYISDGNDDIKVEVEFDSKSVDINPQKVPKIKAIVMHGFREDELILNGEPIKTSDGIIRLK